MTEQNSIETALRIFQGVCYQQAKQKGFHDDYPKREHFAPGEVGCRAFADADRNYHANKMMLIVGEASEAHEELRSGRGVDETYYKLDKPGKPEGIPSEIADIVIRAFDYAGIAGFDLANIIMEKLAYNASRECLHGRKF